MDKVILEGFIVVSVVALACHVERGGERSAEVSEATRDANASQEPTLPPVDAARSESSFLRVVVRLHLSWDRLILCCVAGRIAARDCSSCLRNDTGNESLYECERG